MGLFSRLFGVPTIAEPTLGVLDLSGGTAREMIAADRAALDPLFKATTESTASAPACSVLLIYCLLDEKGGISGSSLGVREHIRDSGAKVVVIATPNPGERCVSACKKKGYGAANLVATLDRKGPAFASFFSRLFNLMKDGVPMPEAWVKLAPQAPKMDRGEEAPGTIFSCELGQLRFG